MLSNQTLIKFAQVQNLINQHCMVKRAYGVGDDFEYIDRMPWYQADDPDSPDNPSIDAVIRGFKNQLAELDKAKVRLYDAPPYDGYPPKMYVSKYRYHMDDLGAPNEISLDRYIKLVNNAIKKRDLKKFQEAARYWSLRGAITDPKAQKAITKALDEYRKTNPEAFID